ncbi:FtsH protease activity modulator HflK [Massilia sp. DWR3-1-1]|uniref:FtsH protease activity modulator HflK n=1 Tax=Massilia sp. DWR3-1-1 TaxID=2804559 RepID=UPI003CEA97F6
MLVSLLRRFGVKLSLNDPRWGHKPEGDNKKQEGRRPGGEGPPDLDQMWRDFNARLNRLFGKNGNNGGGDNNGNGFRPDMKGASVTAGVFGVIALFIWLASGAFIVQEGQVGIVTTFGKLSHKTGAGFNWRWPAPFQAHTTVDVSRVRTAEVGYRGSVRSKNTKESLMLTDDENIIDIQFAVQYTLKDPVAWIYNNRDSNDDTLRQIAETAIREVVGKSKMDFVLYEGREQVALDANKLMQQIADRYALGVQITNVTMQSVQPPEQVQSAFDDAVKAGQDRARAKSEGEAYANDIIPRSRGAAIRLTQDAEAYRSQVVESATGNASRFSQVVAEYQKAPGVTRDRMYLETMQQIFSSASKVMVDAKAGNSMLYLPLDKLIAQTAANDAAIGAKSGPVQAAPAATPAPQEIMTTETARQRDSRATGRERESR